MGQHWFQKKHTRSSVEMLNDWSKSVLFAVIVSVGWEDFGRAASERAGAGVGVGLGLGYRWPAEMVDRARFGALRPRSKSRSQSRRFPLLTLFVRRLLALVLILVLALVLFRMTGNFHRHLPAHRNGIYLTHSVAHVCQSTDLERP